MREASRRTVIYNASVVMEDTVLQQGAVVFRDGVLEFIGTQAELENLALSDKASEDRIDGAGGWVIPGFVDVHVHGGNGFDFMDADGGAYDGITSFHGRNGTTTMLATTVTAPKERIEQVLQAAWEYQSRNMPGAKLAGVHLEGPFISPKWPGAQNPAYIMPPQLGWLKEWEAAHPKLIRLVTLAPEAEGALEAIRWMSGQGIVPSCGHSDASYEHMQAAASVGLRHAVHTFNGMKGIHHREPGTAGSVLSDDRITAEIIADGHHVHPAVIRLVAKCKGCGQLILITDAISAAGLEDGAYDLGGLEVTVSGGVARLKEGGNLAGSTLTMMEAFRFAVQQVGLTVQEASRAASGNPARQIGIDSRTGSLRPGKLADLLLVSRELQLERVWIEGRELSRVG